MTNLYNFGHSGKMNNPVCFHVVKRSVFKCITKTFSETPIVVPFSVLQSAKHFNEECEYINSSKNSETGFGAHVVDFIDIKAIEGAQ